jgi:very-short-patch-repair endonuclease
MYKVGIHAIPQFDVEQYTLDFAIFVGDRKLNIEVDGERYHKDWTGELCRKDQIRNLRLIELGWEIKRFWVYEVRDDLSSCVTWVRKWIDSGTAFRPSSAVQSSDIETGANVSKTFRANDKSHIPHLPTTNISYSAIARCSACGEPAIPGDTVCYQCKSD